MAEIKIEKKTMMWPWILAGIGLVALILYVLFFRHNTDNNGIAVQDTTRNMIDTEDSSGNAVSSFITYVDSDTTAMSLDHDFTSSALMKLADATQFLADNNGYSPDPDIEQVNVYARKITIKPLVDTHADNIRRAAEILSNSLQTIQKASFPQLNTEAEKVRAASSAIKTDELTLDQKAAVRNFFNASSDMLKKMN